jgi:hypothetical protein
MTPTANAHERNTIVARLTLPVPPVSTHRVSKRRHTLLHNTVPPVHHEDQSTPPPHIPIGTLFSNGEMGQDHFKCLAPGCFNKTFRRAGELRRHHKTTHAAAGGKPRFWCPVEGCKRSRVGGKAFPRKDKMHDHLGRVHASIVRA